MGVKEQLIEASRHVGARVPLWVQGAGGNLSWRDGERMWIKASGQRLEDVSAERGLVAVDWRAMEQGLARLGARADAEAEREYGELVARTRLEGEGRPSMETGMHVALRGPFVAHFHSLAALLMADASVTRAAEWRAWAPAELQVVPYVTPGLALGRELAARAEVPFLVLTNHGVITQGASADVLDGWDRLEREFLRKFGYAGLPGALTGTRPRASTSPRAPRAPGSCPCTSRTRPSSSARFPG
jgi:rhamnose utilization protein RhaD (predicted bifunctional aldolase and dehydrogenase)